jgi:hypothetical protein
VLVEATNPSKFPVTAFVTAPAPTDGDVQTRVEPPPVHVPAVPAEAELVDTAASAEVEAADVATEAAVAWKCLLV